ncbi:MAG: glycosyltransferase family 9 protein [Bacillota bacterium]
MGAAKLERGDRFALFWGGGLGDVLVIRPLLLALEAALNHPPYFFTTATHLQGLFPDLGLRAELHVLPKRAGAAWRSIRNLGFELDWLYLGAYPRFKTRLLAQIVGAKHIWSVRHGDVDPFLGEQVLADVRALGLNTPSSSFLAYGGAWNVPDGKKERHAYLLLHPGVKPGWQTKQWPDVCWSDLMRNLLSGSDLDLMLVGTPGEAAHLTALVAGLDTVSRQRVHLRTELSLQALAATVRQSHGVICHNSGVLHLAAMLGRPTLSLTGSSPHYWRPPYPHVLNLSSGACNLACDQYRCPVPFYRARCIRELSVTTVMAAAQTHLLAGSRPATAS